MSTNQSPADPQQHAKDLESRVLSYWFKDIDETFSADFPIGKREEDIKNGLENLQNAMKLWFKGGKDVDEYIITNFKQDLVRISDEFDKYYPIVTKSSTTTLSTIILFDQFPRSVYRSTGRAFDFDSKALKLAKHAVEQGFNKETNPVAGQFFILPLMHSENLDDQDQCVEIIKESVKTSPENLKAVISGFIKFGEDHRDLIRRFGRFPYRNKVLNRESTKEEIEYLSNGAETYGQ
ncbi:hypothetical protein BKA69DRAFT_1122642 [Paraphysoderma sedebokerense]|nr:hypothetical protein BKA69DRAFT_1122642 [Paraphysoderma sedebokerense]